MTLNLTGSSAVSNITVSPATVEFDTVVQGTTKTQTLTVSNTAAVPLALLGAVIVGPDSLLFSVSMTFPYTVRARDSVKFPVQFAPTSGGNRVAAIYVLSDAASGTPAALLTGIGKGPRMAFTPAVGDFGTVAAGDSGTISVTLRNVGNAPLTITLMAFDGTDRNDFHLRSAAPTMIAAGDSASFVLRFTASHSGPSSGSLIIQSNLAGGPQSYPLLANQPPSGIDDAAAQVDEWRLELFPNPTPGRGAARALLHSGSMHDYLARFSITDVLGRTRASEVARSDARGEAHAFWPELRPGIYEVQVLVSPPGVPDRQLRSLLVVGR
jgi:hypothetical protein